MRTTTIKTRFIVTIMVTSLFSLCVACLVYSLYNLSQYRSSKKNELKQMVELVSPLLIKDLTESNERVDLWKTLIAQNRGVERFIVYRSNFIKFDEYSSSKTRDLLLVPSKGVQFSFDGEYCIYNVPIVSDGQDVGYVTIDYYLLDRIYGFRAILLVFLGIFILSTVIAYVMSCIFQSQFNKSIVSLVDVAKSIFKDKNYKAKAIKHSSDEFGLLTDTINDMLEEISRRELEMHNLNEHLESRVETRTAALQEINSRLLNEKTRADQASLVKSDFLANMSHEIRTPMNGIVAACDLAVDEELTPKVTNYLKIIQSSSHTLLLIINDILDFSKLEAGTLELEESPFSLAELLCKLSGIFRTKAERNNIELTLDVDSQTPDLLIGDCDRFQQILCNLLDNGIKFTSDGKVSLHIVCLETKEDTVILECRILDTGVGLSNDGLNAIFQSFHQIDSSSTRRFGGTGLGLAITKKLAIMMGGTIEVSSKLGEGSAFVVTVRFGWKHIPLGQSCDSSFLQPEFQGDPEDLLGKHVLLAESNETSREIAEAMLTGFGMTVESVENGELALLCLKNTEYDFVILDMQMPVLNGFETLKLIREMDQYQDLLVIALTAQVLPGDKDKCLQAGANAYLGKPMSQNNVREVLCKLDSAPSCRTDQSFEQHQAVTQTSKGVVLLDVESAAMKLGVEVNVYKNVLKTFYYDYENVDTGFLQALEGSDLNWFKKSIHSLKGSSSTIGAENLTLIATKLDSLCKKGVLPSAVQVQDLLFEVQQVKDKVKSFIDDIANTKDKDEALTIIDDTDVEERFNALAQALDESLYDKINKEMGDLEINITGSQVINLGKMINMYAYDDALDLLYSMGEELGFSFDNKDINN